MFMDSAGSSHSTSHESGTSTSGTFVAPPTWDRVPNAMTALLDPVRETIY